MPPTGTSSEWDWAWVDVAVPRVPGRLPGAGLPGVSMAGFGSRVPIEGDIAMVAHPSVTLIIDLSDGDGIAYRSGDRRERGSAVIGLMPGDLRAGGRIGACLQIRLEPVAAAALLGAPAELTGSVVPLEDVWGRDARLAEERLRAAPSWDERFAVATEMVARRMRARPPVDPEVAHIWRRTLAHPERVRVEALADEVGWSRKRLWSRFRSQLGISPKRAARLVRFDRAARLLAAGLPAARVAAQTGYADQPHLHREVRTFTGLTPAGVAEAPWLAIDDVAWPSSSPALALTASA